VNGLPPEVLHEPLEALVGSGRQAEVAEAALAVLPPGGIVGLEVGGGQAPEVEATLRELGYEEVRSTRDLAGCERVVEGMVPCPTRSWRQSARGSPLSFRPTRCTGSAPMPTGQRQCGGSIGSRDARKSSR